MSLHRVVITGLGAITPIGNNVADYWQGLLERRSGAGPITRFDPAGFKVNFACEVKGFDPLEHFDRKEARRLELFVQYAIVAARQALEASGLDIDEVGAENIGAMIGSGIGGLQAMEEQVGILIEKGPDRVAATLIPRMIANMSAGMVGIHLGLKGPNSCPVTACATSTNAIGDAFKVIQRGQAVAMIAGGTESTITKLGVAGFQNMKALSERTDDPTTASRPFSVDRDGFVMGEGAGILALEEYEHAKARGVPILAEIVGYGMTCDAHHITAPAPDGEGLQRCMRMALRDAGLTPGDVGYINAHGTSTPLNDKLETAAIKAVFGELAPTIPVSSNKGCIGHLLGAAGAVESIASIRTLQTNTLAPTANYSDPDPECDLDYIVEGPRQKEVEVVMTNNSGFGGHNASLVFRKAT